MSATSCNKSETIGERHQTGLPTFLTEEAMERRAVIEFDNVLAWLEGHPQNVCAL